MESEMTPGSWIASTVSERTTNLRGEAEQQRLTQRGDRS
jgi:hypothetical protein